VLSVETVDIPVICKVLRCSVVDGLDDIQTDN
jgi:hypothetical protein